MQTKHRLKQQILSILLILMMILSTIPSAFASIIVDVGGDGGSGGAGNATSEGNKYNGDQFFRCSILWAPLNAAGTEGNWDSGEIKQVGNTVDVYAPGHGPAYGTPQLFGDFAKGDLKGSHNNAKYYMTGGDMSLGNFGDYHSLAHTIAPVGEIALGKTKEEADKSGQTIQFPVLAGDSANGVNVEEYFSQYYAYNTILYRCQDSKWPGAVQDSVLTMNVPWQGVSNFQDGYYKDEFGALMPGQFIILVESGIFGKANGHPAALTVREVLALDTAMGGSPNGYLSKVSSPIADLCNNLYIQREWKMLGLDGRAAHTPISSKGIRSRAGDIQKKYGVGVIQSGVAKPQGLPITKYFYDLSTGKHTEEWVWENADNIKPDASTGVYTAKANEDGFTLVSGSVSSLSDIQGNIEVKQVAGGGKTEFVNAKDKSSNLSPEAKAKLTKAPPEIISNNNVKVWGAPKEFVSTVSFAQKLLNIVKKQEVLKANADGTISFNGGSKSNDLQLSLLYIKGDRPKTYITKLYYDDPSTGTPTNRKVEEVAKDTSNPDLVEVSTGTGGYEIKNEDPYKVTNWTFIEDKIPHKDDDIGTWDKAEEEKNGKEGTSTGKLTEGWTNPDKELVIRYEKITEQPPEVDGELYLPERRISWLKSLTDIGGIPTINFEWDAITGDHLEYDDCGSEKNPCRGHSCTEHVEESHLSFVSSNSAKVNELVIGYKTGFMPYDSDNFYEFNRSDDGGTYNMNPNYHFVVWRGTKDNVTLRLSGDTKNKILSTLVKS